MQGEVVDRGCVLALQMISGPGTVRMPGGGGGGQQGHMVCLRLNRQTGSVQVRTLLLKMEGACIKGKADWFVNGSVCRLGATLTAGWSADCHCRNSTLFSSGLCSLWQVPKAAHP